MLKCPSNTYWVNPGRLLAGEYPLRRDENEEPNKIEALLARGVNYYVDLTELNALDPYENLLPKDDQVIYQRFPIQDVGVPKSKRQMIEILDTIDGAISKGNIVYVHCHGGIGRTGMVVGCYLSRHGYPGDKALAELNRVWSACRKSIYNDSPETREQRNYIVNWKEWEYRSG